MIFKVCLFFLINIFSYTIIDAIPYGRYRRQLNPYQKANLPYEGWGGGSNNPSGGSPGAYYGSGVNPNYGQIGPDTHAVHDSVSVMNYNGYNSNSGNNLNSNQQQQQQQQQQYYLYNNNNNRWQRPNLNNYDNQPYNRYPPGSQGWYATGGNYGYNNKGQSLISHAWLLIISIVISIICT